MFLPPWDFPRGPRIIDLPAWDILAPQIRQILGEAGPRRVEANRGVLRGIVTSWYGGARDMHIRSLLQTSYSLALPPSVVAHARDLRSRIDLEGLVARSFLPDGEMDRAVEVVNRALVESIQRPHLTKEENASRLGIHSSLIENILFPRPCSHGGGPRGHPEEKRRRPHFVL